MAEQQLSPDAVEIAGKKGSEPAVNRSTSRISATPQMSSSFFQAAQAFHKHIQEVHEAREKQKAQRRKAIFKEAKSEEEELVERVGDKHWRVLLLKLLHSKIVQLVLALLLVLDIVIVLSELFVEAEYPSCHRISPNAISCCPSSGHRQLGGGSTDKPLCVPPLAPDFDSDAGCDDHKYPAVHVLHSVAFIGSATILCIFEVELLATLVALGTIFIKNPLYLLDLVVVTISLAIDFHLHLGEASAGESSIALLIVARCWRFVRVIHGIVTSSHEHEEEKLKEAAELARELKDESEELTKQVEELDAQVGELLGEMEAPPLQGTTTHNL